MFVKSLFVFAVITAIQGNVVQPSAARHGNENKYFLFTREYDRARTPIPLIVEDVFSDTTTIESINIYPQIDTTTAKLPLSVQLLDSSLDTVVVAHGHADDAEGTFTRMITNAFFSEQRKDINVNLIVVDWSAYAQQRYNLASDAVPSVGIALGTFLKLLVEQKRIQSDKIHLIGFNLGAHVVGFAGRTLNVAERITGLDPSGSRWGSNPLRLSKLDARYVEVIHTDGDGIFANGIGTVLGHVDFFVNGGNNQPGCLSHTCNHNRAYEVFAATLTRGERLYGSACRNNLQLTMNRCNAEDLFIGGDEMFKRHSFDIYRVNTRRSYPF